MRLSLKELTIVASLGALWGSVEMTLGSFLHVWHVPFVGVPLGTIGITIALVGRRVVPRRGSTLAIAVIAALLKALSVGGVVLAPMIAIVMEGLIAEIVLSLSGKPRRSSFMLAEALAVGWSLIHPIIVQGIVFGAGIITAYGWVIGWGASLFHVSTSSVVFILVALVVLHLGVGALGGLVAWQAGNAVLARRAAVHPDEQVVT